MSSKVQLQALTLPLPQALVHKTIAPRMRCPTPSAFRIWLRTYVSASKKARPRKLNTVSLDHFLQRTRALALWRRIVRDCSRIKDQNTRKETLRFAREEFERHRGVTDIGHIRYLISTGKTQWDTMERYIDGL